MWQGVAEKQWKWCVCMDGWHSTNLQALVLACWRHENDVCDDSLCTVFFDLIWMEAALPCRFFFFRSFSLRRSSSYHDSKSIIRTKTKILFSTILILTLSLSPINTNIMLITKKDLIFFLFINFLLIKNYLSIYYNAFGAW